MAAVASSSPTPYSTDADTCMNRALGLFDISLKSLVTLGDAGWWNCPLNLRTPK